jgi:flagellar basal body rod protein FlgG
MIERTTFDKKHVSNLKKRGMPINMGLIMVFLLIGMSHVFAYEDYGEILDIGMRSTVQSMESMQVHWVTSLLYTMNVDTPGYLEQGAFNTRVDMGNGEYRIEPISFFRWRAGPVVETKKQLDFYVDANSKGWFLVRLPGTTGYTRDGRFQLDSNRRLVTLSNGYPVLGEGGDIYFPEGDNYSVSRSGLIFVDGEVVDRMKIAVFASAADMHGMETLNGSFFILTQEGNVLEGPEHYNIQQGFIEQNNVIKGLIGDITTAKNVYIGSAKAAKAMGRIIGTGVGMGTP